MQFLFWRLERGASTHAKPIRVWIFLRKGPNWHDYEWEVADRRAKRLSKVELHELETRVAKHVEIRVENTNPNLHLGGDLLASPPVDSLRE